MITIGSDDDGVTSISLNNIKTLLTTNMKFSKIHIHSNKNDSLNCYVSFIFKGDKVYKASGFSIGYCGTGPRGLHKAILAIYPDYEQDFNKTKISKLNFNTDWIWTKKRRL